MDGEEEKTSTTEEDLCVDHQMPRHVEARHQPPDCLWSSDSWRTIDYHTPPEEVQITYSESEMTASSQHLRCQLAGAG
jgi:hypothetical protein